MKNTGKILIILGVVFGILGIRSLWREYKYHQVVTTAKTNVLSVETKPFSGKAVASIQYKLVYQHDYTPDTISYSTTEEYSTKEPLPSLEELKAVDFYVHYVPKSKQSKTAFPNRIYINNDSIYKAEYRLSFFVNMLFCFVVALFFRTKKSIK